jgi:hypothetical protein
MAIQQAVDHPAGTKHLQHRCPACGEWLDYAPEKPLDAHIRDVSHLCGVPDEDVTDSRGNVVAKGYRTADSYVDPSDGLRHNLVDEQEVAAHYASQGHTYPRVDPEPDAAPSAAPAAAGSLPPAAPIG